MFNLHTFRWYWEQMHPKTSWIFSLILLKMSLDELAGDVFVSEEKIAKKRGRSCESISRPDSDIMVSPSPDREVSIRPFKESHPRNSRSPNSMGKKPDKPLMDWTKST